MVFKRYGKGEDHPDPSRQTGMAGTAVFLSQQQPCWDLLNDHQ
ncbi:hypothetical protein B4113_0368 [Geobacillus sp. B4113_201601]|nr:hypothetical protein B4113_0368 [Geobacillus sp. B4113_201601]